MLQQQFDDSPLDNPLVAGAAGRNDAILSDPEGIFHTLLSEYEDASVLLDEVATQSEEDLEVCKRLLSKLKRDLISLGQAANKAFYAPLKKKDATREIVLRSEEEHKLIKRLLLELDQMSLENEHWPAKLSVLRYLMDHHVEDTREVLYPLAQKILVNTQSRDVAARFEKEREKNLAKL